MRLCDLAIGLAAAATLHLATGCEGLRHLKQGLDDEGATLRVELQPATGATVWVDGLEVGGPSPVVREGLAAGAHRLEVRAPGYHPFSTPLELHARQRLTLAIALRPLPRAVEPPAR